MIVVTTPTGMIGRQVLDNLLAAGAPVRVIARDAARLAPSIRELVDVVEGSHGDAATVDRAFAGAEAVFWLPPTNPRAASLEAAYLDFTRPACAALERRGVARVVAVSALGRGTDMAARAGHVTASLAMDDMIAETGVSFRALTMPSFMDNVLRQVVAIRDHGVFFSPLDGDRRHPTCATRDIAAVAARLLLDPTWSGQESLAVLGPEDLSFEEMAATMASVLGKPVRFQQVPFPAFREQLSGFGMSEAIVQGMVDMMAAKNAGLDDAEPRTPDNTTPTSFRRWCEDVLKPAVLG
jgi:uncharacterized protein YbjT (DUF2867 family)